MEPQGPSAMTELAVGDVIAGRYRLEEQLGSGGFGVVFRAVQVGMGRAVALKLLHRDVLASRVAVERFLREGRLAQRLEHPNTVRLYDLGQTDDGLPFIAYQLLNGRSLEAILDDVGALPPSRVARVASQVLKSLMEAHEAGIVHRDIKPANIFLVDFQGEPDFVKVLDFGIGKPLLADPDELKLTRQGEVIGTPSYMAPEQVGSDVVGPAADFYALGLVMAEMLTGRPVFVGSSSLEICQAQISEDPVPLGRRVLRSPLGSVIARAAAKEVAERYGHAGEMLADIEEAVATTPASTLQALVVGPAVDSYADTTADKVTSPTALLDTVAAGETRPELAPTELRLPATVSSDPSPAAPHRAGRTRLVAWLAVAFLAGALLIGGAVVVVQWASGARSAATDEPAVAWSAPPTPVASSVPMPLPELAPPRATEPATPPAPAPAAAVGSKLADLTPILIRQRLIAAGWHVDTQTHPAPSAGVRSHHYDVTKGPARAHLSLYEFPDVNSARASAKMHSAIPQRRAIAEHKRVLLVDAAPRESDELVTAVVQ